MQTKAEKREAIESLLPFIFFHLDFAPGAERTTRQEWISAPSPLDPPKQPAPVYNLDCAGRCWTCIPFYRGLGQRPKCPPEEKWKRQRDEMRAKYRIEDIEECLTKLSKMGMSGVIASQAVWAVYVEPWPGALVDASNPALGSRTESISEEDREYRAIMAQVGINWMVENIEDDVLGYGERRDPVENQIRQLASQGFGTKRIAKELKCRPATVQKVLVGVK